MTRSIALGGTILLASVASLWPSYAANFPPGFEDTVVTSGVNLVIDFDWAPDGSFWIASKTGEIWRQQGDELDLVADLPVFSIGDSGLATLRVDPLYESTSWIWVHYTNAEPWVNRLSHFTHVVNEGGEHTLIDEVVILEHVEVSSAYNGGCLQFMDDGTLFVATGYDGDAVSAQNPHHLRGKLLRLERDGTAAPGGPFDGKNGDRRVWSYGLRESFRCTLRPGTEELFIGDVGNLTWEEINVAVRGGNFGWGPQEGPTSSHTIVSPFYAYPHDGVQASAVIGGAFIEPGNFPADYVGDYLFADFNRATMYRMRLDSAGAIITVEPWATEVLGAVSIRSGPDHALYYALYPFGEVHRIARAAGAASGGRIADLRISRAEAGDLFFTWDSSCLAGDTDYAIYEGPLGKPELASRLTCSTSGATEQTITPSAGDKLYLVVPHDAFNQGSLGTDSAGIERPAPVITCFEPDPAPCGSL